MTRQDNTPRLISWNVQQARSGQRRKQIAAVKSEAPDLVCLQEITRNAVPDWRSALSSRLPYLLASVDLLSGGRRSANLIASAWPLARLDPRDAYLPWPEKLLSVMVDAPGGALEVHVAHAPAGVSWPEEKVETFEGIFHRLARHGFERRILCGDFNSPKEERGDTELVTYGRRIGGVPSERWEAAERGVLQGLADFDLRDAFRRGERSSTREATWIPPGQNGNVVRRYDHLFVSGAVEVIECGYRHDWRAEGLSDHSALVAELALAGAA